MYHVFGYRKQTVKDNLKLVFPEKSDLEIETITKKFFHHFCDMILESIKSMNISLDSMKARYTFKNLDIIKDFEKQNKSIVLMCAHYGSWEWIFILQTYTTHRGYGIYKRLQNKYFDRLIKSIRARYNSYLITTKETFSVLEEAKKNGILSMNGFASDQSPKKNKARHWNEFMGIKVPVHTGAEVLAKKLANSNPESMKSMKQIMWADTDLWDSLLLERAEISGERVLSEFTRKTLLELKNSS